MRRGDVVVVREPGTPAGKARPCVVVHRDGAAGAEMKVTVCPLTSHLRGVDGGRPLVVPTPENRLHTPSEVQVDWIYTHPIDVVGEVIGQSTAGHLKRSRLRFGAGSISDTFMKRGNP